MKARMLAAAVAASAVLALVVPLPPATAGPAGDTCWTARWFVTPVWPRTRTPEPCERVVWGEAEAERQKEEQTNKNKCTLSQNGYWYRNAQFSDMVDVGGVALLQCESQTKITVEVTAFLAEGWAAGSSECNLCKSSAALTEPSIPVYDEGTDICLFVESMGTSSDNAYDHPLETECGRP